MNKIVGLEILCLCLKLILASSQKNTLGRLTDLPGPMSIEVHIKSLGYPFEAHEIVTEDGYILTYHRIPHGKDKKTVPGVRTPVLVQHGLLASSGTWVIQNDALAFVLADAGFDVWLGNARGNSYSRRHNKYDPDGSTKSKFWRFSWHEMGYYDIPASIDYILNATKHSQLLYVGHSIGTTMFFVLGATKPAYLAKVKASVHLAPFVFPYNIKSTVVNFINEIPDSVYRIVKMFDIYEVLPFSRGFIGLAEALCTAIGWQAVCRYILFDVVGFDDEELEPGTLAMALNFIPAGASLKEMEHFAQISKKGASFRWYDYGLEENLEIYGQPTPPKYDLQKVKTPLHIFYGENDWLSVPKDVGYLASKLKQFNNNVTVKRVPRPQFNHFDFLWASDGKKLVYDDITDTLKKSS